MSQIKTDHDDVPVVMAAPRQPINPQRVDYTDLDSVTMMEFLIAVLTVSRWVYADTPFIVSVLDGQNLQVISMQTGFVFMPATARRKRQGWTINVSVSLIEHMKSWQQAKSSIRRAAKIKINKSLKL